MRKHLARSEKRVDMLGTAKNMARSLLRSEGVLVFISAEALQGGSLVIISIFFSHLYSIRFDQLVIEAG
jgi:hypothetical protein